LFVDEAAQMSLANVLAVSQAAKTVLLCRPRLNIIAFFSSLPSERRSRPTRRHQ
jgi:hypothetical protein